MPFNEEDYRDLQAWFNLSWIDPYFRKKIPELQALVQKARFFSEEDKGIILDKQIEILKGIIPAYKKFLSSEQIEVTTSPYYHPILPLLYNTNIAKEANTRTRLPKNNFSYPLDARTQVLDAVKFYQDRFGQAPLGMWPSEEAVSEHILPFIIEAGLKWIIADEALLFKSRKLKKRDPGALYQPYLLKREEGAINIIFRDRNLSDLIGFTYHAWKAEAAVDDFMRHLENISLAFKAKDTLVTVALDGENAWEYYTNDGHDFLELLYARLSESKSVKASTVSEYLNMHPAKLEIGRLASGSWIHGNFNKWLDNPAKVKAWEYLKEARDALAQITNSANGAMAWKQMYILEGSDWFWWFGEDPTGDFDRLFRMHLKNLYTIIGKQAPEYLNSPL